MTTQIVETGVNFNKPIQLPAWVLVVLLGGGGSYLTWHEFGPKEPPAAVAAPLHHDCGEAVKADVASLKTDVAALKVQMDQMDARLARIEEALINGKR
jgi:hypothetical protein